MSPSGASILLVFVDLYLYGSHFNPTGPIAKLMPEHRESSIFVQMVAVIVY